VSRVLVVAKAPVPGEVKTRLGADIGMEAAAQIAAASLLDTLRACRAAYPVTRCHLALAGDARLAVRAGDIEDELAGWDVFGQEGTDFAQRLVHAHGTVAGRGTGTVVQIGMDTPQVTAGLLRDAEHALGAPGDPGAPDAVLGPAEDGGWWVLGLRDGRAAAALRDVPLSTPTTYDDTRAALRAAGQRVVRTASLRDIDTVADAEAVAMAAPGGQFAAAWRALRRG
jgi:glycosyltransferase A (GT-A) superfamily protein (DUF2064 family)